MLGNCPGPGGRDRRYRALTIASVISLSLSGATAAEIDGDPPEVIIVTGSHSPRSAALVPSETSVYDAESIEASQAQGLTEFLRFIPSLHVTQDGARGGRAALFMRGLDPNHVVVLVDGIRLNDPTTIRGGAVDPTTLALLDIDRIEVVRGPLSAVYGSDALAGAINIITRRTGPDEDLSASLSGAGGRFDTWSASGRVSAGLGFAGVSVAGGFETNGDPHSSGGYQGANIKATLDADLPGNTVLRANVRFSESESEAFPVASGGPLLSVSGLLEERDTREVSGGLQFHQATNERLDVEFLISHSHRWEELDSPAILPVQPRTESSDTWSRTQLSASARLLPFEPLEITLGGDIYWEAGGTDTTHFFPDDNVPSRFDLDRRVGGIFAEGLYQFPLGLNISASVRGDFPDEGKTEWSPAVGATLEIPEIPLAINGSWSEGYKLPSFFALANALVGNPDLKAERSRGWEIGLRANPFDGRVWSRITYFDIRVEDLIDFDSDTFTLVNRSRMRSRGIEVEVEVPISERLRFGGSATFNPTDIRGSSDRLPRRPRWRGELHVSGSPLESVELGARVLFVGDSSDFSIPTGDRTLDGYAKVNVTASWRVHDRVTLLLVVENLFDADFQEAIGFPDVGIYPRVGARVLF